MVIGVDTLLMRDLRANLAYIGKVLRASQQTDRQT